MTTTFILDIGNKGSGKTLSEVLHSQYVKQTCPKVPIVANTPIWFDNERKHPAIYRQEILKWLAVKTVLKDTRYAYVIIDEGAIAGLEARGSQTYSAAPNSYLLALSRKVNVDIRLISQMMSMVDKRAQWLTDYANLAIGHYQPDTRVPEFFEYQVYDETLKTMVDSFDINAEEARQWLFPRYKTGDIPIPESLLKQWIDFFGIRGRDYEQFRADMNLNELTPKAVIKNADHITKKFAEGFEVTAEAEKQFLKDTER